jgi:GR25 family glycosyltransferase involved in LPS biosynthesis
MDSTKNNLKHYWINCQKHESRREEMDSQLTKLNIKHERINAFTPETLPTIIYPSKHKASPVEIACTTSHLKAIQKGLVDGDEWFIVIEDDIQIVFDIDFEKLIKLHPNDGIYQLMTIGPEESQYKLQNLYKENILFSKWQFSFYSTIAYLINRNTAKKLIDKHIKNNIYDFSNDNCLVADVLIYKNANTITSTYPLYCTKIDNKSTIHCSHQNYHSKIMTIITNFINKTEPPSFVQKINKV